MSFILDALKKSETDRQQQGAAEFSTVPVSADKPGPPKWLWALAALLTINIVVLAGVLIRSNAPLPAVVAINSDIADMSTSGPNIAANESARSGTVEPVVDDRAITEPTFAEQVTKAKEQRTARESERSAEPQQAQPARPAAQTRSAASSSYIPTFDEARVQGLFQMTDLHLDIHVFGDSPSDRFVFINMAKHRENSQLSSGPVVREITPDGVILEHEGTTFLLPRE